MKINTDTLRKKTKPLILRCRSGDWEHAKRVVEWVKVLGKNRRDLDLIVTAAYIHDIGWRDILSNRKISFDELLKHERIANENSTPYATKFLEEMEVRQKDIKKIIKLIRAADAHKSSAGDEEIIVDSDNLSKLDINHLKEKYKSSEWMKMAEMWEKKFPRRIKTGNGKQLYPGLLKRLKEDILTINN